MAEETTNIAGAGTSPARPESRAWRAAAAIVVFVVLAVLVVWRLRASNFHWSAFAASFRGVNWWWFGACIVLNFGAYFGRALRWQILLRPVRANASLWNILKATLIGFTALVLFGRPGELVRPYLIASKENLPFSTQMAAWFLERIFDLLMVLAIFSFALTQIPPQAVAVHPTLDRVLSTAGWVAGVLAVICFTLLFILSRYPEQARARLSAALAVLPLPLRGRADGFISTFVDGMQSLSSRGYTAMLGGYTILEWALIVGMAWAIFKAFPATANLGATGVCIFLGFVAFGSMVQIPGIGGGPQVAGAMALSQILAIRVEPAAAVSVVFWFVSFIVVVPVGVALALHEGVNWGKLSHLKEDT